MEESFTREFYELGISLTGSTSLLFGSSRALWIRTFKVDSGGSFSSLSIALPTSALVLCRGDLHFPDWPHGFF